MQINQMLVAHPEILATWEPEIEKIMVLGQPEQVILHLHLQNNQRKWIEGVAQEVGPLLCEREAVSSNPRPIPSPKCKGSKGHPSKEDTQLSKKLSTSLALRKCKSSPQQDTVSHPLGWLR
jgi:hypothetical protein